jgi:hypothetical protein
VYVSSFAIGGEFVSGEKRLTPVKYASTKARLLRWGPRPEVDIMAKKDSETTRAKRWEVRIVFLRIDVDQNKDKDVAVFCKGG